MSSVDEREVWGQPLLRWAGSKRKLLPTLLTHVPPVVRRYYEPFAGSACLFFAINPPDAVLGDINTELIRAYEVVRAHPRLVCRRVESIPTTKQAYYKLRATLPEAHNPIDRAARFVYLNRFCFNGVYRINRQGQFNVPHGRRTGSTPPEAQFYRCSVCLRSAELRTGDFEEVLKDVAKDDFVYLDPPYSTATRTTYGEYGYERFESQDIPRLIRVLRRIDRVGAVFLLSYSPRSLLINMPDSWFHRRIRVRRHVAGFAKARRRVEEVLVSNRPLKAGDRENGHARR